jgi:hypothetical protein
MADESDIATEYATQTSGGIACSLGCVRSQHFDQEDSRLVSKKETFRCQRACERSGQSADERRNESARCTALSTGIFYPAAGKTNNLRTTLSAT